jgi:hypothetical protein
MAGLSNTTAIMRFRLLCRHSWQPMEQLPTKTQLVELGVLSNTIHIFWTAIPPALHFRTPRAHTNIRGMLKTLVASGQLKGKMQCGHTRMEIIHKLRQMFQHLRSNRRTILLVSPRVPHFTIVSFDVVLIRCCSNLATGITFISR